MKMQRIITLLTFLMIMFMATGTVSADLNSGLVAHYPFNGNANDESGNGNHGTVNGATLTNDRFGNANSAYSFDGVDDEINMPGGALKLTSSISFGGWFKPDGTGGDYEYALSWDSGSATPYVVEFDQAGTQYINVYSRTTNEGNISISNTQSVNNQWYHVFGVVDLGAGLFSMYINGVLIGSTPATGAVAYSIYGNQRLQFGSDPDRDMYNGLIDDIRIYNRALTASEIQELYQGNGDGLVAHYPFNGNANDESGNGNHGTVNGATLTTDRFGNANSAYSFDGVDDYLDMGDISTFELSNYTVSVWVKGNNAPSASYERLVQNGLGEQFTLDWGHGDTNFRQSISHKSSSTWYKAKLTSTLSADTWYHFTGTYDGSNLRVYLNGNLETTTTSVPAPNIAAGNLFIGGGDNPFQGLIDDVRIYNRTLTASEVQELYQEPAPGGGSGGDGHSLDAADGNPVDAVFVDNEGNVGIGTTNPGTYKLAVNGKIKTKEVVVETTGWSDFVFEDHYVLMPLGQLEKYIKSNKHLPQIPSAEEVAVEGIKVGTMQSRLLQKIEELTLYMIKLEKQNEMLNKRLKTLEKGKM